MLKACFFTWDDPSFVSGCRSWIERLLPELAKHSIEACVLYLPAADAKPTEHIQTLQSQGIACFPLPPVDQWTTQALIAAVREELSRIQPNVFVPNFWLPGYYAAADLRADGIETIGVLHSDDPYYWGLVDSTVGTRDKRRRIHYWAAVSKYLADELRHKKPFGSRLRVAPIPAGVRAAQRRAEFRSTPFRIGYFGRIVNEQKRILDVAKAMLEIVQAYPSVSCEIYGLGVQQQELERWLQTHAANHAVRYFGGLDSEAALQKITEMQAILLLSEYEGLSVTLMEAMAAGVPPISYDCASGTRELIQHEKNGFVVTNRDSQVVHAVGSLLSDPLRWNSMSQQAVETLRGPFSIEHGAALWAKLMRQATRSPTRALSNYWSRLFSSQISVAYPLPPVHDSHGPALDIRASHS